MSQLQEFVDKRTVSLNDSMVGAIIDKMKRVNEDDFCNREMTSPTNKGVSPLFPTGKQSWSIWTSLTGTTTISPQLNDIRHECEMKKSLRRIRSEAETHDGEKFICKRDPIGCIGSVG